MAYKTPGVYIEEISLFPPSVAEVETAVPAFIGYTEKAEKRGQPLKNIPTKISSLLEYMEYFGGAYKHGSIEVKLNADNTVNTVTPDKTFYMHDSMRQFFDNGGGNCYIVSVGDYKNNSTIQNGDLSDNSSYGFRFGLKALEKYDEPTMILFPDATLLTDEAHLYALQQQALTQCARLQDRVAIFDLKEKTDRDLTETVAAFRNNIGINNLKYGTAYTPWLNVTYAKEVDFSLFSGNVKDPSDNTILLESLTADENLNKLVVNANRAAVDVSTIRTTITTLRRTSATLEDEYNRLVNDLNAGNDTNAKTRLNTLLAFVRDAATALPDWKIHDTDNLKNQNLVRDLDAYAVDKLALAVHDLIALEKNGDVQDVSGKSNVNGDVEADYGSGVYDDTLWLAAYDSDDDDAAVDDIASTVKTYDEGDGEKATAQRIAADLDPIFKGIASFIQDMVSAAATHKKLAQMTLYEGHSIISNIVEHIKTTLSILPSSASVAGVYAYVDRTRGVWKAPANVSLNSVRGPTVPIDHYDQEELNIDVNSGKSINAIRTFTGRGVIVWGARTLAGNDNEWRYIPVRRFYNMVEESVKKSTMWAVFEPNAAPLWCKVKGMIDNYLVQKWREGALAGATPEQAFFVKVGLGQTMTAQDIQEGRLIMEIGMAVVRPAEFIILRFSHKMQEA